MRALLISTYDLGHQPFGLASPAAWLKREGLEVRCADLSKEALAPDALENADLIAFHLPMHTATRLAAPVIRRARAVNPGARLCAYGLYAPLNDTWLRSLGVEDVMGGEFEGELAEIARTLVRSARNFESAAAGSEARVSTRVERLDATGPNAESKPVPKLHFLTPDRSGLLPLTRYATIHLGDGRRRVAGYTETSRGCRHLCRHCPVVPVYNGQFRVIQPEVVLEDIEAQVAAGAEHITFGDPDFFNGPTHGLRIVEAVHRRHPAISYDVTIKIEHLLAHRDLLPRLRETGCLFVTSAVESVDDRVLAILEKGHTRRGFVEAVDLCRAAGLNLAPTFVAFHPWASLEDYCGLLDTIVGLDLVDHVAPIQLAIRLLIPAGSRLLELAEVRRLVGAFDEKTLTHRWTHADPRVDTLQQEVSAIVGRRLTSHRRESFAAINALARERAGLRPPPPLASTSSSAVPFVDEPWYCCAEPNPERLTLV